MSDDMKDVPVIKPKYPRRLRALTSEKRKQFLEALELGGNYMDACAVSGVPQSTWMGWVTRAKEGHLAAGEFLNQCEKAVATGKLWHLRNMKEIACGEKKGNWLPNAWSLERRFPDQFSLHDHRFGMRMDEHPTLKDAMISEAYQIAQEHHQRVALPPGVEIIVRPEDLIPKAPETVPLPSNEPPS